MRTLIKLLCLLPGLAFSSRTSAQQDYRIPKIQASAITVSNLSWSYPNKNGGAGPLMVSMSVTNNGDKPIKSIKLLVIAKNKKGTMLQSQGTTIRQLTASDTIKVGETKRLSFIKGYDNPDVNDMELKEAIIEFFNGSLERIPGKPEIMPGKKNGY